MTLGNVGYFIYNFFCGAREQEAHEETAVDTLTLLPNWGDFAKQYADGNFIMLSYFTASSFKLKKKKFVFSCY